MKRRFGAAGVLALGMAFPAAAQEEGDPVEGLELATQLCTGCHLVGPEQIGTDVAPPFPVIARDPELTLTQLHAWPGAPHPVIPDLALSEAQIADINAYLDSLREIAAEPVEPVEDEEAMEEAIEDAIDDPDDGQPDDPGQRPEGASPEIETEEPPPAILQSPPEEIGPPIEPSEEIGPPIEPSEEPAPE